MDKDLLPRITIRNCLVADMDALDLLWIELGATQNCREDIEYPEIQREYRESYLKSIREEPGGCFIALLDNETVGSARAYTLKNSPNLCPHKKIGGIGPCVVRNECRKKGIGTRLMKRCFEYLKREGCNSIIIHVFCTNIPALRFYEKLDFKIFGGRIILMLLRLWVKLGSKPLRARKLKIQMIKRLN